MSTNTTSPKEEFFRTKLIFAGQLAEVYLHHTSKHQRNDVSRILFENLGLASVFAISPATPSNKALFAKVGASVQHIIELLKSDLEAINCPRPTSEQSRAFRSSQATVVERLKPHMAILMATMGYAAEGRASWLNALMEKPTPLTPGREYKKWRTFVRNLDFHLNMQGLGLADVAKALPVLGSHQGKAEAPVLWRKCFDTDWTNGTEVVPGRPYLPAGVSVKSTAIGMLVVTHSFDHRQFLKKALAALQTTPPEVEARLSVALFSKTCDYTELVDTVAEVARWVEEQNRSAEATQLTITQAVEASKMQALRAKLASTFSPEELALLSKVASLPSLAKLKAPARPRARKT